MSCLLLSACQLDVKPPQDAERPQGPEYVKVEPAQPAPQQPTGPQPWSSDLDLKKAPAAADPEEMAEGLVAGEAQETYSKQRLTYESAFDEEKPQTEAERARQLAQERAAAAGMPVPPQVAAAPVAQVDSASLPAAAAPAAPTGETPDEDWAKRKSLLPAPPKLPPLPAQAKNTATTPPQTAAAPSEEPVDPNWAKRNSLLPAPPKFPPLPAQKAKQAAPSAPASEPGATAAAAAPVLATEQPVDEEWAKRGSALPAPPKLPPQSPAAASATKGPETTQGEVAARPLEAAESAKAQAPSEGSMAEARSGDAAAPVQTAMLPGTQDATAGEEPTEREAKAAGFATEAWDAPSGTLLVQVSAVQNSDKVVGEWHRLQALYPQVLKPLRLVVEQAKLGNRGVFYRVQAGAFDNREGATRACKALIDQGQACFVVVR